MVDRLKGRADPFLDLVDRYDRPLIEVFENPVAVAGSSSEFPRDSFAMTLSQPKDSPCGCGHPASCSILP